MPSNKPQSTYNEILAGIGSLDDIDVYHNLILVGIYMRPDRTAGGVLLTDKTLDEDKWQGKAAVVLKKGPLAFKSEGNVNFAGQNAEVGDWLVYRISDGFPIDVNGIHCRLLEDTEVRMRVKDPLSIY